MISVIIPLYNKEPIIERSLQSVLSQDYDDFEVVVVNDGSTDRSADIVRSINDPRIRLIEQENGGPSKARNTGTKNARGEWILFLDADDELLLGALRIFYRLSAEHSDADIIDCGQKVSLNDSVVNMSHSFEGYSRNPMRDWYLRKIGPGSNHSIFKKDKLLFFLYDEKIRRFEDAELLTRILRSAVVFSSKESVSLVHAEYSAASHPRKDISEDFMGHLDISKGGFWYKMCVFRTFIEERDHYKEDTKRLYPHLYKRYDLLLFMKILSLINRFVKI